MQKYVFFLVLALVPAVLLSCKSSGGSDAPDWVGLMLSKINSNRPADDKLTYDSAIAAVARAHAKWLDQQATYAYQSTGSGGTTPSQRLTNAGVSYITANETGCWTSASIDSAFNTMNSGGLLTNLTYTHVGIAAYP